MRLGKPILSKIIFLVLVLAMFQFLHGVVELDCALVDAQHDKNYVPISKAIIILLMIFGTVERAMQRMSNIIIWVASRIVGPCLRYFRKIFRNKFPKTPKFSK